MWLISMGTNVFVHHAVVCTYLSLVIIFIHEFVVVINYF